MVLKKNQLKFKDGYIHWRCDKHHRLLWSVHSGTRKLNSKAKIFQSTERIPLQEGNVVQSSSSLWPAQEQLKNSVGVRWCPERGIADAPAGAVITAFPSSPALNTWWIFPNITHITHSLNVPLTDSPLSRSIISEFVILPLGMVAASWLIKDTAWKQRL